MTLHILRLAFGIRDLAHLRQVLARRVQPDAEGRPSVVVTTRNHPRRSDEVLDGGSLYWIVKGQIRARQRILAIEDVAPPAQADGPPARPRCAFRLDPDLVLTRPRPRGAQQGWRYLRPDDAPPDLETGAGGLSPDLASNLRELGLID